MRKRIPSGSLSEDILRYGRSQWRKGYIHAEFLFATAWKNMLLNYVMQCSDTRRQCADMGPSMKNR